MAHLDGAIYHALPSSGNASQYVNLKSHLAFLKLVPHHRLWKVGVLYWRCLKFFCANLRQFLCCLYVDGQVGSSEWKFDVKLLF
jgi:hypothetical protein